MNAGLTPRRLRDEREQVPVVLGGGRLLVEAPVHRRLIERRENGAQGEVALGVAPAAGHRVIVVEQAGDFPSEAPQDVPERLAHQTMGAHHSGQRRIMLALVTERLRLSARRQYGYAPYARVPGHRCDHVIANGTQEGVCCDAQQENSAN